MNTYIEIHEHNTVAYGTYRVWYKDETNETCQRTLSESLVNSLLNMEQKHLFFMGQYRFKINEYDFKHIVLLGEVPAGF